MQTQRHLHDFDDDNDTQLLRMLQEYVLTHYPNPERTGCLSSQILGAMVFSPESLDLSSDRFLHVFKCAECTRDLIRYREMRSQEQQSIHEESPERDVPVRRIRVARAVQ